jgi:hypothetical protein
VAKKTERNTYELMQEGKGVKGTSIGHGARKHSTMSKHQKRSYKAYRGQG